MQFLVVRSWWLDLDGVPGLRQASTTHNWDLNRSKIVFGKPPILLMNRVEDFFHLGVVVIFFLPRCDHHIVRGIGCLALKSASNGGSYNCLFRPTAYSELNYQEFR